MDYGVNAQQASYQAATRIFNSLPPLYQSGFESLCCGSETFSAVVHTQPEDAYRLIRAWVFRNLHELEKAGGASPLNFNQSTNCPLTPDSQLTATCQCSSQELEGDRLTSRSKYVRFRCNTCESNTHHWMKCPLTLTEKFAKVSQTRRCYNCLGLGHYAIKCESLATCRNCAKYGLPASRHHTTLCSKPSRLTNQIVAGEAARLLPEVSTWEHQLPKRQKLEIQVSPDSRYNSQYGPFQASYSVQSYSQPNI